MFKECENCCVGGLKLFTQVTLDFLGYDDQNEISLSFWCDLQLV